MNFCKSFINRKGSFRKTTLIFGFTTLFLAAIALSTNIYSVIQAQQTDSKTGIFNHTQTDSTGNVSWINSGNWSIVALNSSNPSFDAIIEMSKPNGSAGHEHEISNFNLTEPSIVDGETINLNGTSTITMRDGPVTNLTTIIALYNESVDVYFDPGKIDNHFENQSISGIQK